MTRREFELTLVGGPPSSGSTLLSVMLDSHPEIFCGPETNLLAHPGLWHEGADIGRFLDLPGTPVPIEEGVVWVRPATKALEYYNTSLDALKQVAPKVESITELMQGIFVPLLDLEKKRHACEKSPSNIYAMSAALSASPSQKAVIIVRDAPGVLRSLARRKHAPALAAMRWLASTNLAVGLSRSFGPDRVHLVRYEDLVVDPLAAARALCIFLGVDPGGADAMVSRSGSNRVEKDPSITDSSAAASAWRFRPDDPIAPLQNGDETELPEHTIQALNAVRLNGKALRLLGPGRPRTARWLSSTLGYETTWHRSAIWCSERPRPDGKGRLYEFYRELASDARLRIF